MDFVVVAPKREVKITVAATKQTLVGEISRRAPAADPATRTIHFEVDIPDPERRIPTGTTGVVYLDVGEPVPATVIPVHAASVRGKQATLFVVEGEIAHARTVPVLGEANGELFLAPDLAPGALVVTEGRAALHEGDRVRIKVPGGVGVRKEGAP
jgi:multidrug efflux pump subunit AcrA (membrane-fusion protein)